MVCAEAVDILLSMNEAVCASGFVMHHLRVCCWRIDSFGDEFFLFGHNSLMSQKSKRRQRVGACL
jgi:hypothetical protein